MDMIDAQRVVTMLNAAFPNYPMAEDTSQLYVTALVDAVAEAAVAYAVVQDWITSKLTFPKVAELLEECEHESSRRYRRASAIRAGQNASADPTLTACTSCGDTGWEHHAIPDRPGYEYAIPCAVCRPVDHRDHAEGHIRLDHDVDACEWPRCKRRSKTRPERHKRHGSSNDGPRPAVEERADVGPGF